MRSILFTVYTSGCCCIYIHKEKKEFRRQEKVHASKKVSQGYAIMLASSLSARSSSVSADAAEEE